jgi:hypothetical protein
VITPEEIEEILNTHGDTLTDLPSDYDVERLIQACEMAETWAKGSNDPWLITYICHQSDVIEKLVAALKKENWEDEFLLD